MGKQLPTESIAAASRRVLAWMRLLLQHSVDLSPFKTSASRYPLIAAQRWKREAFQTVRNSGSLLREHSWLAALEEKAHSSVFEPSPKPLSIPPSDNPSR